MKHQLRILLIIISAFLALHNYANDDNLKFIHYTNEEGLPSSYLKSICQDHYGFAWIGLRTTVCSFDRKYFKPFHAFDGQGIPFELFGKKLSNDNDTLLIVQTIDNKYYTFDFALERFNPYNLLNDIGKISGLIPSGNGFWIFREGNLKFLDEKNKSVIEVKERLEFADLPDDLKVVNLREKDGKIVALNNNNSLLIFESKQNQQFYF